MAWKSFNTITSLLTVPAQERVPKAKLNQKHQQRKVRLLLMMRKRLAASMQLPVNIHFACNSNKAVFRYYKETLPEAVYMVLYTALFILAGVTRSTPATGTLCQIKTNCYMRKGRLKTLEPAFSFNLSFPSSPSVGLNILYLCRSLNNDRFPCLQ